MANEKQVAILKQGVDVWNAWRRQSWGAIVELGGEKLFDADISGANLGLAGLVGVNLVGANLSGANLRGAKLISANLRLADLSDANLSVADLSGANLEEANLSGANLSGADLSDANLTGASVTDTVLGNTNLTGAVGLDTCRHFGPSTLDHRTLAKSGPVPLAFLRGCGLPESLISYLPSLLNRAIQFYSCFISYSTKDQDFADRLYADLQNKGVRCWFAPHDMAPGKKLHEQIDEAIRLHDKLLLILSEHSMNSEWVKTEIRNARQREVKEKRQMLFPVSLADFHTIKEWKCFDAEIGKDSAVEIREFFIPNFSIWKTNHDAYQENFDRLLKSLQAKETASAVQS